MNADKQKNRLSGLEQKPFLGFYGRLGISPVRQDIRNLPKHFSRRSALYRQLGLAPALLKGKSLLEFGPGSGHNAVFTTSLNPKQYVLVDGNPSAVEQTKNLLRDYYPDRKHDVQSCLMEDFSWDDKFDVVFCEGLIPTQRDPALFSRQVASFVDSQGLLVITCMDAVSLLSESIRQIVTRLIVSPGAPLDDQVRLLLDVFSSHLDTLRGMSRKTSDWVLDVLIHPWVGPLFSIQEAIDALDDEFDFYGSSPDFVSDWRWYKDIWLEQAEYNRLARDSYKANLHSFLDYRYLHEPREAGENDKLQECCERFRVLAGSHPPVDKQLLLRKSMENLDALIQETSRFSPQTAACLEDAHRCLDAFAKTGELGDFGSFTSFWGRGQQYLSFIRREG
jgi:hypothetical protein